MERALSGLSRPAPVCVTIALTRTGLGMTPLSSFRGGAATMAAGGAVIAMSARLYYAWAMTQTDDTMPDHDRPRESVGSPDLDTRTEGAVPAAGRPKWYDPDWQERIERARNAREEGRKARQGKPIVFSIDDPRPLA